MIYNGLDIEVHDLRPAIYTTTTILLLLLSFRYLFIGTWLVGSHFVYEFFFVLVHCYGILCMVLCTVGN